MTYTPSVVKPASLICFVCFSERGITYLHFINYIVYRYTRYFSWRSTPPLSHGLIPSPYRKLNPFQNGSYTVNSFLDFIHSLSRYSHRPLPRKVPFSCTSRSSVPTRSIRPLRHFVTARVPWHYPLVTPPQSPFIIFTVVSVFQYLLKPTMGHIWRLYIYPKLISWLWQTGHKVVLGRSKKTTVIWHPSYQLRPSDQFSTKIVRTPLH